MAKRANSISDELLATFMDGNTSLEETQHVLDAVASDEDLQELMNLSLQVDEDMEEMPHLNNSVRIRRLPMLERAAQNTIDNLCAVRCEGYTLRTLGIEVSDEDLEKEAREKEWLQTEGTPLHCIGQLAGKFGVYVSHRYDCSLEDISRAIQEGSVVVAVIDNSELMQTRQEAEKNDLESGETPNHAVVVSSIDVDKKVIEILELESSALSKTYPIDAFCDAWNDSANYLVIMSNQRNYEPHPLNLDDVPIEPELLELREAIAENAHEVWAKTRKEEGWTYGPERDDVRKLHPDMLPYNLLPESEKEYDRLMAINTIKLVKKLGWCLVKGK